MVGTTRAPVPNKGSRIDYSYGNKPVAAAEIRSHSSVLYNERVNSLLFVLDMSSKDMHIKPNLRLVMEVRALLLQIWKNIRTLVYNNPAVRKCLSLDVKGKPGYYTPDIGLYVVQQGISAIMNNKELHTYNTLSWLANELDDVEIIIKEILQYYKYFIRPDYKQKPDMNIASMKYAAEADKVTLDQLRSVLGKRSKMRDVLFGDGTEQDEPVNLEENFKDYDEIVD